MFEDACVHCNRPITSDRGGPGALWYGHGFKEAEDRLDWACDQHHAQQGPSSYGKHEPEVYPDEVEAAIESIRKDS